MTTHAKELIQNSSAVGMLVFGAGMCVASFCTTHGDHVDDSCLWILGQCLIFAGSIFGIGVYINQRIDFKIKQLKQNAQN